MHQPAALNRVLRFGAFELDVSAGELRKDGVRIRLQGQPFQVLCILLERAGEIVSRDELRQRLWPEGTFVDFEHSLNTAIKKVREGLGDDAENPRFVETISRRGYRFIGDVAIPAATPSAPPRAWPRLSGAKNVVLAGSAACALVLLFLYYSHSLSSKAPQPTIIPVVTNVGEKFTPSLSPDGQRLAYAWNGGTGSEFSLYVKLVGTEEPLRLTKRPSIDFNPVWSPDV